MGTYTPYPHLRGQSRKSLGTAQGALYLCQGQLSYPCKQYPQSTDLLCFHWRVSVEFVPQRDAEEAKKV